MLGFGHSLSHASTLGRASLFQEELGRDCVDPRVLGMSSSSG